MHLKLYAFYSMHLFLYTSFNAFLSMNFLLSISLYVFYSMHFTYPINHLLYAFISMLTFHYYYFVTLLIFIKSFVIFLRLSWCISKPTTAACCIETMVKDVLCELEHKNLQKYFLICLCHDILYFIL